MNRNERRTAAKHGAGGAGKGAGVDLYAQALRFFQAGQLSDAESSALRLIKANPQHVEGLHLLGVIAARQGRYEAAVKSIGRAVTLRPDFVEAQYHLGLGFAHLGRRDDAADSFRRVLALQPDFAQAHSDLGNVLRDQGHIDEAIAAYRHAIDLRPDFAEAYSNLGNAYGLRGQWDDAVAAHRRAVALRPDLPELHNNLGNPLREQGKADEAMACYRRALALRPDFASAHNNLGSTLFDQGQWDDAAASFRRAIALQPDFASAHVNLGKTLREQGKLDEAIAAFRRALAIAPDLASALGELVMLRRRLYDWDGLDAETARLLALAARHPGAFEPFQLLALSSDPALQRANTEAWARRKFGAAAPRFDHAKRAPGRKIRVGYLSADFRTHPVAHLAAEVFERHDRQRFDLFGYSIGPDDASAMRQRLERAFDPFVDLRALNNTEAAKRIHADGIDILIDLTGYTGQPRPGILVQRPAPVQANWFAHPGTSGAGFVDYILIDATVAPADHHAFFTEKVVHLPHCYLPYDTTRIIAATPPTRAACGLPEDVFVFCSFNTDYKIAPKTFDLWMQILNAVPGSVLWLRGAEGAKRNLGKAAAARGVDPGRLVFAGHVPVDVHFARHRHAGLFLDTLPYNAHSTASDALWAGVPVLTLIGTTFPGRVAASMVRAAGLPDLVTTSEDDYRAMAIRLARDPDALAQIRQRLADNRATAPLFDTARFTRTLEAAYEGMWRRWWDGTAPEAFAV